MKESVLSCISNIKRESYMIEKMLLMLEENKMSKFTAYNDLFKVIKDQTDSMIKEMIEKYSFDELATCATLCVPKIKSDLKAVFTFAELMNNEFVDLTSRSHFSFENNSFREENNKNLLLSYLWGIQNEDIPQGEKDELRDLVLDMFVRSQYIRNYFCGRNKAADALSDPDKCYGMQMSNEIALREYYELFNQLIDEANKLEMFEELIPLDRFNAEKRLLKYKFVALCIEMEKRGLSYSEAKVPISNFSYKIIEAAADSNRELKKSKNGNGAILL